MFLFALDFSTNAKGVLKSFAESENLTLEFWKTMLENPTADTAMGDFAVAIDNTPKIVFSHTLKNVDWKSANLASQDLEKEVLELKQSRSGGSKDILVRSRSLIIQLMKLNLIDEYQLCVHPVIAGSGLPLFEGISEKIMLKLIKTKMFSGGAVILYYERGKEKTANR